MNPRSPDPPRRAPRAARWRRLWLPVLAVALTVGLLASDWPLGWSFWVQHPLDSALIPGLLLLLVAAVLVDGFIRHREEHRWQDVGGAAAGEFYTHFVELNNAMDRLLGLDEDARTHREIDHHLILAAERAKALLAGTPAAQPDNPYNALRSEVWTAVAEQRLPILLCDEQWRDQTWFSFDLLTAAQSRLLSQWASVYAVMGDESHFRRLGETVGLIDMARVFQNAMLVIWETDNSSEVSPVDESMKSDAIAGAIRLWTDLYGAVLVEASYWARVNRERSTVVDPWKWRHDVVSAWIDEQTQVPRRTQSDSD